MHRPSQPSGFCESLFIVTKEPSTRSHSADRGRIKSKPEVTLLLVEAVFCRLTLVRME